MDTTEPSLASPQDPGTPAPGSFQRSSRRWAIALVVVSLVLLGAGVVARYVELPYDTLAPGSARMVNSVIEVKGHPTYPPQGKVFYTTVAVRERVNPYEALAGWLDPAVDVIPETEVRGTVPPEEFQRLNVEAMADSKTVAQVLALRQLGFTDLGAGAEVVEVQPGMPAAGILQRDDVITAVDGKPVANSGDAVAAIRARAPGDTLRMQVKRGDGPPFEAEAVLAQGEEGRPLLGVRLSTKIRLPFEIDIDSGRVVGPSAGLAYGLELLDLLTPGELTGGSSVAATGDLRSDGSVGAIGGVGQKTVTVRRAGIKVFIVPKENEAEAQAHADGKVEIRGVSNFEEALQALGSLDGSNAMALGKPAGRT
ncbi:MAG TPA: PDZ domain-containing protein [Acidimicrobiales bacterium]|nr:PDZ domain-containing protein [Acidimicrobiales bacterium]